MGVWEGVSLLLPLSVVLAFRIYNGANVRALLPAKQRINDAEDG